MTVPLVTNALTVGDANRSFGQIHCIDCKDSKFLFNCRDCRHCLFCANLEGKEYHVFNKPVSPEEYEAALAELELTARRRLEDTLAGYQDFLRDQPMPHAYMNGSTESTGNYLFDCKDANQSFECSSCEDIVLCVGLTKGRQCVDGSGYGVGIESSAQFVNVGAQAKNVVNCVDCWGDVSDLAYSVFCEESSNLFGCVGLRQKEYCIFNKQYSKSEYLKLRAQIQKHLHEREIWGTFFPSLFSSFAYNRSAAQDFMALSDVQAAMVKYMWDEADDMIKPSQLLKDGDRPPDERFSEVPTRP